MQRTLENFTSVFDALEKLFNPTELGEITREFFESIRTSDDVASEKLRMRKEKRKEVGRKRQNITLTIW